MTDFTSTDNDTNTPAGDAPLIGGVRVVGIPVSDQDAALRFYVDTLGFQVQVDTPMPQGGRWIMVVPRGADDRAVSVALVSATGEAPAGVETGIRFHTPRRRSHPRHLAGLRRATRGAAALARRAADVSGQRPRRQPLRDHRITARPTSANPIRLMY